MTKHNFFYILSVFCILACKSLQAQLPTVNWITQNGITQFNQVFIKETDSGWQNGIAITNSIGISEGACFDLSFDNSEMSTPFKLGFSNQNETDIDASHVLFYYDGSKLILENNIFNITSLQGIKIIVDAEGIFSVTIDNVELYQFQHSLDASANMFIHLGLNQQESILPLALVYCGSSGTPVSLPCSSVSNKKHIETISYSNTGEIVSHSMKIVNNFGLPTFVMNKNVEENEVLAKVICSDKQGRTALQTLEAPIGSEFCIDEAFAFSETRRGQSGSNVLPYNWQDFDQNSSIPNPISPFSTLGQYYNGTNKAIAQSEFPFLRNFYADNLFNELISAAGYHPNFFDEANRSYKFKSVSQNELDNLYGMRGSYIVDNQNQPSSGNNLFSAKEIIINSKDEALISYYNLKGKILATALSSASQSTLCSKQKNKMELPSGMLTTVHIPASCVSSLSIELPDPMRWYKNGGSNYPIHAFDIKLYDQISKQVLVLGLHYNLVVDVNKKSNFNIQLLADYSSKQSVLGISVAPNALATSIWWEFLGNLNINLKSYLNYETNYTQWALTYYNKNGDIVKVVQPEGVDCGVDATNSSFTQKNLYYLYQRNKVNGTKIFELDVNLDPNFVNTTDFCIKPFSVTKYNPTGIGNTALAPVEPESSQNKTNGPGNGGIVILDPPVFTFATMDQNFSQGSLINSASIPNPDDPTFSGDKAPHIPDDAYKVVYSKGTSFKLNIYGKTEGGAPVLLKEWNYETTKHFIKYLAVDTYDNGTSYLKTILNDEEITRTRDGILLNWDTPESKWFKLDDWDGGNHDFSIYDEIFITISNLMEHPNIWLSESNCPYYPTTTAPSKVGFHYFSFFGNLATKFSSAPSLPNHNDNLSEFYKYNNDGLQVERTLPDVGKTQTVYSSTGILKFEQNAVQQANNRFSYIRYDNWDRKIESGVFMNPQGGQTSGNPVTIVFGIDDPGNTNLQHTFNLKDGNATFPAAQCGDKHFILYDLPASDFPVTHVNFVQTHLAGRISKSWNLNSSTWYSYDYLGRLKFSVTQTPDLGFKTIRYAYNHLDQVTTIFYDELGSKPYYVTYSYDSNQQLLVVSGSETLNGVYTRLLFNSYDLHGRLINQIQGNDLQGIDYYYSIEGKLKSINNAINPTNDDDLLGLNNVFSDLFAETLHYYEGDYQNTNHHINSVSDASMSDNLQDLVKGSTWYTNPSISLSHNIGSKPTYSYEYDANGQLINALFGSVNSGVTIGQGASQSSTYSIHNSNNFKVQYNYDLNGNVKSLNRYAYGATNLIDNLSFSYPEVNSLRTGNKLLSVTDNVASSQFAEELTTQSVNNYSYDEMGRLVGDIQRDVHLTYNVNGQVVRVENYSQSKFRERNTYNEGGFLIKKEIYAINGGLSKTQYWVNSSNGKPYQFYEELYTPYSEGIRLKQGYVYAGARVATVDYSSTDPSFKFELKDHIGNVRATYRENTQSLFQWDFTNATLNNWDAYSDEELYPSEEGLYFNGTELYLQNTLNLNPGRYTLKVELSTLPSGPILINIYDSGQNLIHQSVGQVNTSQILTFSIENPDQFTMEIAGDNVTATEFNISGISLGLSTIEVLGYADYYPFGWEMPGRKYVASGINNQFGYQGDNAVKNDLLSWNSFKLRNLDSRIGRWLSVDPATQYFSSYKAMGNNPISIFDPDGAYAYRGPNGQIAWFDDRYGDEFTLNGSTWTIVSMSLDYFVNVLGGSAANFYKTTDQYAAGIVTERSNPLARMFAQEQDRLWHSITIHAGYPFGGVFDNGNGIRIGNGYGLKAYHQLNTDYLARKHLYLNYLSAIVDEANYQNHLIQTSGRIQSVPIFFDVLTLGNFGTLIFTNAAAKGGQTIIGEGMKRVSVAAAQNPGSVILNNMPKFIGTAEQVTSQMMTYNRQWILQQMRSGRPILDIGLNATRANPSIFYQMEQNMMRNYLKLHPNAFQVFK